MARYGILVAAFAIFSSLNENHSFGGNLYHVTDLGVPPDGGNSYAYQVNINGQAVGFSQDPMTGAYHPFLWSSNAGALPTKAYPAADSWATVVPAQKTGSSPSS
jgi:uncharacterized membrane protein